MGSLLLHALILAVFLVPYAVTEMLAGPESPGAGGPGPAGGGGGGLGGTGGAAVEGLIYIPMNRPAAPAEPTPTVEPPRPVPPEPPPPVVPPPEPRPIPTPQPETPPSPAPTVPQTSATDAGASVANASVVAGVGGGSGNDGSRGFGPGSGGGIGSGVGTGRGSGLGPGTGGGPDSIYPPSLVTLALPPLEAPRKLRPFTLVAFFDVDERGNTKLLGFNETSDSRFNRRVREVLAEVRFRPAVRGDGRPVRDTGRFEIEYP